MMSHVSIYGLTGTMLLLAAFAAEAQEPHSQSQTSVVRQLSRDGSATRTVSGRTRELRCRGKPGIDMRIHQDSSPRYPHFVTMVLRYEPATPTRSVGQEGMGLVDYGMSLALLPGMCTWNAGAIADIPPEPGVVYFDLRRDAQAWAAPGARDTTITAAVNWPDIVTLPRYFNDPERYWIFYVDDVMNVSISFGAWQSGALAFPGSGTRPAPAPAPAGTFGGTLRGGSPATATPSSVRTPTPTPTGSVAGPLRDKSPSTATSSAARTLPTDTAARRTAAVRMPTPTPTGTVAGPLRDISPGTATPSTSRVMPTDSAAKLPDGARARSPRLVERRLSSVRTAPGPLGVRITFDATGLPLANPQNSIRVEIEFEPPAWNSRERRWSYPVGWEGHWFADVDGTTYGSFEAQPWAKLVAGRRYYYLITVSGTDALPEAQRTGAFTADIRTPLNGLFSK